jgi:glyoxylase-like metal-dependent hydrolase (beta-lactamase superfamily II)
MLSRVEVETMSRAAETFLPAYAGRVRTFEWDQPVLRGVTARDASGHTPGHTVFEVDAGGSRLWIVGDLIHFAGVQLPRPEIAVTYDTDPVKAVAARKRVFDKAAAEGVAVAGMHLLFPGIGKFSKAGAGYGFEPER